MGRIDTTNAGTKKQMKDWIEGAIREAKNMDPQKEIKEKIIRDRDQKKKRVAKHFGL